MKTWDKVVVFPVLALVALGIILSVMEASPADNPPAASTAPVMDPVMAPAAPKPLTPADRLLVREAQLTMAQAHIARLQADGQVKDAEAGLLRLLQSLKAQYSAPDCELQSDMTWKCPPPSPAAGKAPQTKPPAPSTASGQTSKKE